MLRFSECSLLVVSFENSPSVFGHETWGKLLTILGHLSHLGSRNELEVLGVRGLGVEEFHLCGDGVVCSDLEWKHINTVKHALHVNEELLTVPWVVKVTALDGVANTSGVTSGNEVSQASANTGAGVPEDLSWATVVHWGWPDGENDVFSWEGTIINESLVLLHAGVKRNIVILAPSTERVEEKDWVLVASLDKLLTGILEEENVTIMKGVADLESVNGIGTTSLHLLVDLTGEHSVFVKTIVVLDTLEEAGERSGNEPVTLVENSLSAGVLLR